MAIAGGVVAPIVVVVGVVVCWDGCWLFVDGMVVGCLLMGWLLVLLV